MEVWLGIDYGLERCGLALAIDKTVLPITTLTLKNCVRRGVLLDEIAAIGQSRGAQAIVMGLPLYGDGGESATSRQARNAAKRIQRRLPLPVYYMPEYLSSHAAEADLISAGYSGKQLKSVLDQVAACRILESFLALPPERRLPA